MSAWRELSFFMKLSVNAADFMDLKNKVALIAGGARMGETIGSVLAKRGAHIVFSYRSSKKPLLQAVQQIKALGQKSMLLKADLSKGKDTDHIIHQILKHFGRLDILINMTSIYEKTPWHQINNRSWPNLIKANLESFYLTAKSAYPALKINGGRVVAVADWLAASGRPHYKGYVPYFTAKAGVIGLTQALALEWAPSILVNAIAPGPILPPQGATPREIEIVKAATPLNRWGGAMEIAKAVLFLCETDFVTGECLRVDGGRHLL